MRINHGGQTWIPPFRGGKGILLCPTCLQSGIDLTFSKVVDGVAYEVDCAMIIVKEGDVDIGEFGTRPERVTMIRCLYLRLWSE